MNTTLIIIGGTLAAAAAIYFYGVFKGEGKAEAKINETRLEGSLRSKKNSDDIDKMTDEEVRQWLKDNK